jgi:hypothetical protein
MIIKTKPIDIKLSIETSGKSLIAHLLFFNATHKRFYLDKHSICFDGKFTRNVFAIIDDQYAKVNYIGETVNRFIGPEEFIWLEVGEYVKTTVTINDGYKLKRGKRYLIQYSVYNLAYMSEQEVIRIESNKVAVIYQ